MHVEYTNSFWRSRSLGEKFSGNAPALFVGRMGYPYVQVGILTPPDVKEEAWLYDAPRHWAQQDYRISTLMGLRGNLVNSRFKAGVMERSKFTELCQDIGLASKPVGVEIEMEQAPKQSVSYFQDAAPFGPAGKLKQGILTENPHIDKPVDKVFSDTDWKASEAVNYLYSKGFDEAFLTKIFSIGGLGLPHQRKLVPTRWTITAVDDNVGKSVIEEIKNYQEHDCTVYFSSYLGNYYMVFFFPGVWSYELFECPLQNGQITSVHTDYESYSGRKEYANNCAGGYYTVRLACAEKLKADKRQARVLVVRVITSEYTHPMGVWVTREATRKALATKPIYFSSPELALTYGKLKLQKQFSIDISPILKQSLLLREQKEQKTLGSFISRVSVEKVDSL